MAVTGVLNAGTIQGDVGRRAQICIVSKSVTPALVALSTTAAQNITMDAGDAALGDLFFFLSGAQQAGLGVVQVGAIATADTLPVTFGNFTAGNLTPTAGVYTFLRVRF